MNLKYSIEAFKTKQVLDKSYRRYTQPFETDGWWGEFDASHDRQSIERALAAFTEERERYFELVYRSDYRDTYRSKGLPVDIYIKHYRVFEAKYSRITIYRRNFIRKTLAKKSFALSYRLKELGIPAIDSLFYAAKGRNLVAHDGLYASVAIKNTVPLNYYLHKISSKHFIKNFLETFREETFIYPMEEIFHQYGKLTGRLLRIGLRGSHKEFFSNTLVQSLDEKKFRLVMCDFDIIDAILPYSERELRERTELVRTHIETTLKNISQLQALDAFDEGLFGTLEGTPA